MNPYLAETSTEIADAARRLYVQLPSCAPKGASSQDWDKMMRDVVKNVHRVADKVFRAVVEDWQSSHTVVSTAIGNTLDDEVRDVEKDPMDLTPWSGIYAGGERLIGLLRLLKEYLANPTPSAVFLQVGLIMDLVMRMFSLTVPTLVGSTSSNNVRFNNQVSKEEREHLWLILPEIHVETMEVVLALTDRLDDNASALDLVILDQLVWVFGSEKGHVQVRAGCYRVLARVLSRSGLALSKSSVDSLAAIIRRCCEDLLPLEAPSAVAKHTPAQKKANGGGKQQQVSANADSFLNSALSTNNVAADYVGLRQAAYQLVPVLLSNIRPQQLSDSLRTRMDRTAILTKHKDAMMASVLNPPPSKKFGKPTASILPLLTRSFAKEKDVESLVRPRMPVVRTGSRDVDTDEGDEDEGEEAEEEEDDYFMGDALDSQLESAMRNSESAADETMADATSEFGSHRPPITGEHGEANPPTTEKKIGRAHV